MGSVDTRDLKVKVLKIDVSFAVKRKRSAPHSVQGPLQTLLDLWATGSDNVKIASFLAVRRMYVGGDDALRDLCLKVSPLLIFIWALS